MSKVKKLKKYTDRTFFYILIRSWNCFQYLPRCFSSVLSQTYTHFHILFVDDHSNYTTNQREYIQDSLKDHTVIFNKSRQYSLKNTYDVLHKRSLKPSAVVVILDGDDYFSSETTLEQLAKVYQDDEVLYSYGDCLVLKNGVVSSMPASKSMPYTNLPYTQHSLEAKRFRQEPFLPLHQRSWRLSVFNAIPKKNFMHSGIWFKYCEDLCIYFSLFEKHPKNCKVITKPLYVYNKDNQHSDAKDSYIAMYSEELMIRKKKLTFKENAQSVRAYFLHPLLDLYFGQFLVKFQNAVLTAFKLPFFFVGSSFVKHATFLKKIKNLHVVTSSRPVAFLLFESNIDFQADLSAYSLHSLRKSFQQTNDCFWLTLLSSSLVFKDQKLIKNLGWSD